MRLSHLSQMAAVASCILLQVSTVGAIESKFIEQFDLPAPEILNEEQWILALDATLAGTAQKELFIAATNLTLSGTFEDDVWALGDTLTFSGTILHSARLAGRHLQLLKGTIGGTSIGLGENIIVDEAVVLRDESVLVGADVVFQGRTEDHLMIRAATRATVKGTIGGKLRIIAPEIDILPDTVIEGDLVYTSPHELLLGNGVELKGELIRKDMTPLMPSPSPAQMAFRQFFFLCAAIFAALPFIGLCPGFVGRSVRLIRLDSWRCLFAGAVGFALLPMLSILALVTAIGIPLGLTLLAIYGLLLYLSKILAALTIGTLLFARGQTATFMAVFASLCVGLLLLYIGMLLPIVGSVIWFMTTILGMGALLLAMMGRDVALEIPEQPEDRDGSDPGSPIPVSPDLKPTDTHS